MLKPTAHDWFHTDRYGLFIHWGPYSLYGRGEQVLFRENLDQREYAKAACAWNPSEFDAEAWARVAVAGGFRYAVLTTRHHDGYCLWDTSRTEYNSVKQAAGRDFVAEYAAAFRKAGLKVGLYYSLADWRIPAYWLGEQAEPEGWARFREDVHAQVAELLTDYGQIDVLWFDGAWPHSAAHWQSEKLLATIRRLQPGILVNNRLDSDSPFTSADHRVEAAGASNQLGDFGTPEHTIRAEKHRPWESCQTSVSRLWGLAEGEHWRPTWQLMDMLCESSSKGGNLLLNVGPDAQGRIPQPFIERSDEIGNWLHAHGEAIYQTRAGDVTEFITYGYQTTRDHTLYLILRFWHAGLRQVRVPHLASRVMDARWLDNNKPLRVSQDAEATIIHDTARHDSPMYPVIKLTCDGPPAATTRGQHRLWASDPTQQVAWARSAGL